MLSQESIQNSQRKAAKILSAGEPKMLEVFLFLLNHQIGTNNYVSLSHYNLIFSFTEDPWNNRCCAFLEPVNDDITLFSVGVYAPQRRIVKTGTLQEVMNALATAIDSIKNLDASQWPMGDEKFLKNNRFLSNPEARKLLDELFPGSAM